MLDRCDFRTCRECSCEPDQCRVQNLGTTPKANDMTGIFTPTMRDFLVVLATAAGLLGTVLTVHELQQQEQQYQASRT